MPGVFCAGADLKVGWREAALCAGSALNAWQLAQRARPGGPPHSAALPPTTPWLQERAGMSQAEAATFVSELRDTFSQLDNLPMPTVACIDGCGPTPSLLVVGGPSLAPRQGCAAKSACQQPLPEFWIQQGAWLPLCLVRV